jgi:hypothetical protein
VNLNLLIEMASHLLWNQLRHFFQKVIIRKKHVS